MAQSHRYLHNVNSKQHTYNALVQEHDTYIRMYTHVNHIVQHTHMFFLKGKTANGNISDNRNKDRHSLRSHFSHHQHDSPLYIRTCNMMGVHMQNMGVVCAR